jgi:hypothetical protein
MNTNGGEVVKFEFDPTVSAAVYTTDDAPIPRLKNGDTVVLRDDLNPATPRPGAIASDQWEGRRMEAGTVLVYVGPDDFDSDDVAAGRQAFNLAVNAANEINYRNRNLWQVTSEPWGFVDYAKNRISVFNTDNDAANWVVVTEDTADYSPRRGNSIGGLDAGETYVIIALEDDPETATDESRYIQLARNENNALNGVAIDLTTPAGSWCSAPRRFRSRRRCPRARGSSARSGARTCCSSSIRAKRLPRSSRSRSSPPSRCSWRNLASAARCARLPTIRAQRSTWASTSTAHTDSLSALASALRRSAAACWPRAIRFSPTWASNT